MAAQAIHDHGGAAEEPLHITTFGRLTEINLALTYPSILEMVASLFRYLECDTEFPKLDFVRPYLDSQPQTWETLATACMMCISRKKSLYDKVIELYPGAMAGSDEKYLDMWNKLMDLITNDIMGYKEVTIILINYVFIDKERGTPGIPSFYAKIPIIVSELMIDPIIIRLLENEDSIIPTTLSEFHVFISSDHIRFDYSKLYSKLCRKHMALQTIKRITRLVTCNPDYAIARNMVLK